MHRVAVMTAALSLAFAATDCPDGAHIIVARGSLEPQGFGILASVKDRLLDETSGADASALVYPAEFQDYFASEEEGAQNMRRDIQEFTDSCPQKPLVLMGYSQGAQVIGDALAGQGESGFNATEDMKNPIAQRYADQVACVIMMGDPSANQDEKAFLAGNSTKNSIFTRQNSDNFAKLGLVDRMQSYCDEGDIYCADGNSIIVHLSYTYTYGRKAASYCAGKIKEWKVPAAGSSTGGGSTSGGSSGSSNSTSNATTTSASTSSTAAASTSAAGSEGSASTTTTSAALSSSTGSSSMSAAAPGASWDLRACGLVLSTMLVGFLSLA